MFDVSAAPPGPCAEVGYHHLRQHTHTYVGDGHGLWRSLAARCVRDAEAPGSNPGSPTDMSGAVKPCSPWF